MHDLKCSIKLQAAACVLGRRGAAKGPPFCLICKLHSSKSWDMQVPDMDAIIQTSDFPCMLRQQPGSSTALPPPVFGYNSHPRFVDVPFPDYSYWDTSTTGCWVRPSIPFTILKARTLSACKMSLQVLMRAHLA